MLRVPVEKVLPGMVLARPIPLPNDSHRFLLQRHREIPTSLIPRLRELGVREVWVRHRSLEFLEDIIEPELGERQRTIYYEVRRNFEKLGDGTAPDLDIGQFETSISELFDYLKQSSCGNLLLEKLDDYDNYLLSHSTNVCYLAMLLGMKLDHYLIQERQSKAPRDAKDLKQLGLGCLLHDVGKMRIPMEILTKPSRLTEEEMDLMKLHPVYGFELVRGRVSAPAAQIVLDHHQRFEGGGYPEWVEMRGERLRPAPLGKQIPVLCRIATICDIFDAATTKRVYSDAKPSVQVLHEMRTICKGYFDPVVEQAFYEIIPAFPIGQVVTLSDGMEAAVVDFNPRCPLSPKVQCLRTPDGKPVADSSLEELDLAIYDDLQIAEVNGIDVRPFMQEECAVV